MKKEFGTSWFPRVEWEGLAKAQTEALKRSWVLRGSPEWSGKALRRPKLKHEKGVGYFVVPIEWGGKGLGRLKMMHEKGFGS